jgi:uncharacterized alkaline shock family protein YloU
VPETAVLGDAARGDRRRGALYVREKVVRRIVERSVLDVPGVVGDSGEGFGGVLSQSLPSATCRLEHAGARVHVSLAVAWPVSLPWLTRAVRDRVATRVRELTGLSVSSVDVEVSRFTSKQTIRRVQ